MGAGRNPPVPPGARRRARRRAAPAGLPFRCWVNGCSVNLKSVSAEWVDQHMKNHAYSEEQARKARAKKAAEQARISNAAGPSRVRMQAKKEQDMSADQRKMGGGDNGKGRKGPTGRP